MGKSDFIWGLDRGKESEKPYAPESAIDDHFTVPEAIGWLKIMTLTKEDEGRRGTWKRNEWGGPPNSKCKVFP